MTIETKTLALIVPLAPLAGAIIAGLFGKLVGRRGAHSVAILGVLAAFVASALLFVELQAGRPVFSGTLYTWLQAGSVNFEIGFLIDKLTVLMMLVVSFVSLMVHIYTIGYMAEDPGYQRFFSYISLFTFAMLMLVMSNNFLQLFFGWEGVGLVSYLLIGFWYQRPMAIKANLKAFLVNRVGDFGFVLGIGLVVAYTGSLNYADVFSAAVPDGDLAQARMGITGWPLLTSICILLFVGAMAKSAQVPLHVWLPDSMEGPTPISALIHAATMVTAGIFMVSRMSPLFELSEVALFFVLIIGATTALFIGFLGIVQTDIKRVVAYSTISQLGYMTVALGLSAYPVAIFHLMTHAFFKALLFLGAGSVIIGMHHDQDMRNMGGLWRRMPITWLTTLVGAFALIGMPFFSGFYSKDSIIEAAAASHLPGAGYAYFCVLAGVFVTALYTFRMIFLVFHGKPRYGQAHARDEGHDEHHGLQPGQVPHESSWVVTLPLILLAIPSAIIGYLVYAPLELFGLESWFGEAIKVIPAHSGFFAEIRSEFTDTLHLTLHGLTQPPFWLALAGVLFAAVLYLFKPGWPVFIRAKLALLYKVLDNKYYLDRFNEVVVSGGARLVGGALWKMGDQGIIDGAGVGGSSWLAARFGGVLSRFQTGHLYQYAFIMILGVVAFAAWLIVGTLR